VQEGMIGVWVADPSRLDLDDPRDRQYARTVSQQAGVGLALDSSGSPGGAPVTHR
jgi:hypothetical protein